MYKSLFAGLFSCIYRQQACVDLFATVRSLSWSRQIWLRFVTNGHTLKCDWYNPVSVFEGNGSDKTKFGETYQKKASVAILCLESGSERLSRMNESCHTHE